DSLILRRYYYDSTAIAEPVAIPDFDYHEITNVEILSEHLLIYSQTMFGGEKLGVYDFNGQPSELLPENPYQYLEMSNYYSGAYSCKDGDDIYFCWLDGGTSERPDEGEYGWNWYMQKFRIPTTENSPAEISSTPELQLYPNPFNPDLNISWEAENMENSNTEIAVYNIKGQQIRSCQIDSCRGCLNWDGRNDRGFSCSTGVYFVRITTGGKNISHKAVLLK
ncbi:MAG: T9SS type A sorting domain-containing protein, partial [Candidatus Stygibacter frigidus]|nr:T9SS type A sorting domain-containing protein [Candidatus Stygibacter frigidus]